MYIKPEVAVLSRSIEAIQKSQQIDTSTKTSMVYLDRFENPQTQDQSVPAYEADE